MTDSKHALPEGAIVDHYEIEKRLGGGGFSIVYKAKNKEDGSNVVIKEYMPTTIAERDDQFRVIPIGTDNDERLSRGRRLFFQEASTLTGLKHPNIVNVLNFFRANGTVYMVMDYESGVNLQAYIKKYQGNLTERFINTVFVPLLHGLKVIHSHGLLHLDIKPGNVHIRKGGNPLLLDFGAAHEMMHTRQFQSNQVVTPGFSPIEQLDPAGYIGPWTDIYALGATMRSCIEGTSPPPSPQRRERDSLKPASSAFKKRYSQQLLKAIDWAMAVDPLDRPQEVDELLDRLPVDKVSLLSEEEMPEV
ncbi:MAG: serine/threonine protein kinase [Gammaproteobacteria bacterium]|nr:serine/threonine protein kinase [Gammaproteobacteria bacterium]